MYRHNQRQLQFEKFSLPFGGKLRSDNRWVKLAKFIPWEEFEPDYAKTLVSRDKGPPAMSVRVALGTLIIKERLGISDEETVEQISENPYLQYFLGFESFKLERPFDPSMLVHFRKRLSMDLVCKINERINQKAFDDTKVQSAPSDDDDDKPNAGSSDNKSENRGKLIVDATCTPADISFPTDLKLLNTAREKSEEIIDALHQPHKGKMKKPRTYRIKARRDFLAVAKSKKVSKKKLRKAIRKQLGYLRRNLKTIAKLSEKSSLLLLSKRQYRNLLVIHEVYRQQRWMYDNNQNRIDDRIVSISQPHVRPIKRGKAKASTEFGAKISASLVDGYTFLDHLDWDNFNESLDLKPQVKAYHKRFGCYPESVHADKIYRTRDNIEYCKSKHIRLSGPALGRPPKEKELQKEIRKQTRQDELDRIPIEGKFGQAKRRFSLSKIMCKLAETSASAIAIAFLVLNLEKWLSAVLFYLISLLVIGSMGHLKAAGAKIGYFFLHLCIVEMTVAMKNSAALPGQTRALRLFRRPYDRAGWWRSKERNR